MKKEQILQKLAKNCHSYHFHLDRALLLRTRMQSYKNNSTEYKSLFNKMVDHEIRCVEIDEQILKFKSALDSIITSEIIITQ